MCKFVSDGWRSPWLAVAVIHERLADTIGVNSLALEMPGQVQVAGMRLAKCDRAPHVVGKVAVGGSLVEKGIDDECEVFARQDQYVFHARDLRSLSIQQTTRHGAYGATRVSIEGFVNDCFWVADHD